MGVKQFVRSKWGIRYKGERRNLGHLKERQRRPLIRFLLSIFVHMGGGSKQEGVLNGICEDQRSGVKTEDSIAVNRRSVEWGAVLFLLLTSSISCERNYGSGSSHTQEEQKKKEGVTRELAQGYQRLTLRLVNKVCYDTKKEACRFQGPGLSWAYVKRERSTLSLKLP